MPSSPAAEIALRDLDALPADAQGKIAVKDVLGFKPPPPRGPARPYEDALKRAGKTVDELVAKHGERFNFIMLKSEQKKIHATETKIDREAVAARVNSAPTDRAVLIKSGGRYYLHTGVEHVTALALRDRGRAFSTVPVDLIDLDKLEPTKRPDTTEWAGRIKDKIGSESAEDQRVVREALREQLRAYGMETRDDRRGKSPNVYGWQGLPEPGRGLNGLEVKRDTDPALVGANAIHEWNGKTTLRKTVAENAKQALADLARDPALPARLRRLGSSPAVVSARFSGIRTMLHEEAHGFSKLIGEGYRGVGVGIEEAGTEILARKATRELLGFTKHEDAFALPTKTPILGGIDRGAGRKWYKYEGGQGSYTEYIEGLFTTVAKYSGDDDVHARVEEAFVATRRWTNGEVYRTGEEQIRDFINNLRSGKHEGGKLPDHVADLLFDELADPKGPLAKR